MGLGKQDGTFEPSTFNNLDISQAGGHFVIHLESGANAEIGNHQS